MSLSPAVNPYPLLFKPILKQRIWGGQALAKYGKLIKPGEAIGESWELADLPESIPGGQSIIAHGPLAGTTLRQAIADHRDWIMGDARLSSEGGFPLLIKFLDAQQTLSVQVHPDERYVAKHPRAHLKSEAWVVVEAKPGAVVYKGLKPHVTREDFAAHIRAGTAVEDLVAVEVKPGDCHYLPSGTCHALGAGILVAEIQTPSDTTFRVYDWNRPAAAGRELHIEQAFECIHFGQTSDNTRPGESFQVNGIRTTELARTDFFEIERIDALADVDFEIVTSGQPLVLMQMTGGGGIEPRHGVPVELQPGATALVPAGLEGASLRLDRNSWMLRVRLPSQLKGKIA